GAHRDPVRARLGPQQPDRQLGHRRPAHARAMGRLSVRRREDPRRRGRSAARFPGPARPPVHSRLQRPAVSVLRPDRRLTHRGSLAMRWSWRDDWSCTVADRIADRNNNFGLMRFAAASLVVLSHSFALTGNFRSEPLVRATGNLDLGSVAVMVFFVMS